jgi:uncharacterized protein (TIGR03067 family)
MRRLILTVVWITVACMAVANEPKAKSSTDPVAKGLSSFVGAWEIKKVQPEGATKRARWLLFSMDGTYSALDKDGKVLWAGTFELDTTTTPKKWDHRSHDAKKAGKDQLGIYELDGDNLKLACVSGQWKGKEWIGKPRPQGYRSEGSGRVTRTKPGETSQQSCSSEPSTRRQYHVRKVTSTGG